jgi:hypothetical protein
MTLSAFFDSYPRHPQCYRAKSSFGAKIFGRWIGFSEDDANSQAAKRLNFDRCAILFANALGDRVPPVSRARSSFSVAAPPLWVIRGKIADNWKPIGLAVTIRLQRKRRR